MTPKQFIKYTQMLDKKGLAVCDGISQEWHTSMFDVLFPIFLVSGLVIFVHILMYWKEIKSRIFKK